MFEKRKETQQKRAIDRLYRDVIAWDQDDYFRLMRSGFRHEECLEMMHITQMFGESE